MGQNVLVADPPWQKCDALVGWTAKELRHMSMVHVGSVDRVTVVLVLVVLVKVVGVLVVMLSEEDDVVEIGVVVVVEDEVGVAVEDDAVLVALVPFM